MFHRKEVQHEVKNILLGRFWKYFKKLHKQTKKAKEIKKKHELFDEIN